MSSAFCLAMAVLMAAAPPFSPSSSPPCWTSKSRSGFMPEAPFLRPTIRQPSISCDASSGCACVLRARTCAWNCLAARSDVHGVANATKIESRTLTGADVNAGAAGVGTSK